MNERIREFSNQLKYLPWALKLVWVSARRWTMLWAFLLIIGSILPVINVYLTREVVNSLVFLIETGGEGLQQTLVTVALMVLVTISSIFLSSVLSWVRINQAELVRDYISNLIHDKATSLDLSFFETPDYYDMLHRAKVDARQRPIRLLENIGSMFQSSLTLIGMMGILMSYAVWLPLVLLLSTLPALWVVMRYSLQYNRWRTRNTMNERKSMYYSQVLTERTSAAELRLFSLAKFYSDAFSTLRLQIRKQMLRLERNKMISDLVALVFSLAVTGAVLLWMLMQALQGFANLGDLAAFYQIFSQGQGLMRSLLSNTGSIYQNILFLENLYEFLHLETHLIEKVDAPMISMPLRKDIRFEDISFRYPGSERYALKEFNWTIPAGKTVALVGENGEGKSTLMKLLARFYDPQEGRVLWDGTDLKDLAPHDIQKHVSILFQQPYHYQETARHNIAVGDLASNPTLDEIERAARAAGADAPVDDLSQGYDTILGKWFGGAELSGGEWQRIALARAFLRQTSIIVLDEPTSSMDSWAEIDWLERFGDIAADKTAIMITHRFTTAMHADVIYVIHHGRITESGTHDELLEQNGRYAESWRAQIRETEMEETFLGP